MRNLFGQEGPVMRAISDLSTLVFLNILTVIWAAGCCRNFGSDSGKT